MPHSAALAAAAPDYGSWADWVSGMGSLLAVCAALIIAWLETRRSRKADKAKALAEARSNARVAGYILIIVVGLKEVCGATAAYLSDADRTEYQLGLRYKEWLDDVREAQESIDRLLRFPAIPLDLYLECDRVQSYLAARNYHDRVRKTSAVTVEHLSEKLERSEGRVRKWFSAGDLNLDPDRILWSS